MFLDVFPKFLACLVSKTFIDGSGFRIAGKSKISVPGWVLDSQLRVVWPRLVRNLAPREGK